MIKGRHIELRVAKVYFSGDDAFMIEQIEVV